MEVVATHISPHVSHIPPTPAQTAKKYEWRYDPQTGNNYQVEVLVNQQSSSYSQPQEHLSPWSGQPGVLPPQGNLCQQQRPEDFEQQLQKKMKGIVQLCEGGAQRKL